MKKGGKTGLTDRGTFPRDGLNVHLFLYILHNSWYTGPLAGIYYNRRDLLVPREIGHHCKEKVGAISTKQEQEMASEAKNKSLI